MSVGKASTAKEEQKVSETAVLFLEVDTNKFSGTVTLRSAVWVAGARPHIDRIVNVRGNVIPLADIRERFGMPAAADSPDTRFLVR